MNDDCKLQQSYQELKQQQDEQTSSSSDGTCRDKYCKNPKDRRKQVEEMLSRRNDLKINEISTNNSTFNSIIMGSSGGSKINSHRNNLNLDLFFDKELSVWSSMMRERAPLDDVNENQIQMRSSNADFESNSCVKLDNEMMANYCNNDSASNSSDSTSSTASTDSNFSFHLIGSSTHHETTNSNTPIPCRCDNKCDDDDDDDDDNSIRSSGHLRRKNRKRLFTDGLHIYGPYDFDLFSNSFYQFGEQQSENEDDNGTFLQRHDGKSRQNSNITELLKNHGDNNTSKSHCMMGVELQHVRDRKLTAVHEGKSMSNNDISLNDGVVINVTNCSNDERDLVKWKDDKNFNYLPASKEACDSRHLIDLIDEGGSCVSKIREKDVFVHDLHIKQRPTPPPPPPLMSFNADGLDVPLMQTAITVDAIDLNNSERFNYERDKIVEITHDDNIPVTMRINRDEHEYLSTFARHAQCKSGAAVVNEKKNSNPDALKINIDSGTDNIYEKRDDVSNKIRFRESEQQKLCEMCGKFRSCVNDNCRTSDKARDECQG